MHPMTDGAFGTPPADRLTNLRDQRALLVALGDDVQEVWRRLAVSDVDASWRSSAQRAYQDRVESLRGDLQSVTRRLEEAGTAVAVAIDRVALEEFRAGM